MKNIEDFIKTSVKIELIKEPDSYGYHPYYMFVEDEEGKINVICIAGVYSILDIYKIWFKYLQEGVKRIYMAVDFPARFEDKYDFVAVYSYHKNDNFHLFAIPYNNKTGEIYERINKSKSLEIIAHEFQKETIRFFNTNF